jgi:hypothetical protein
MRLRLLSVAMAFSGAALPAQLPAAGDEGLARLRATFAALPAIPMVVVAVTRDRAPVILMQGTDAGGEPISSRSLLPLQALAKVLAADAIHVQCKGKVDQGSGVVVGGREFAMRELLAGTVLLPDYYVLDGSDRSVDAAVLYRCGELAVAAGLQLHATPIGAAEFVLLEPLVFGGHYRDWPSMLRGTLAPRAFGFDPTSADALDEKQRSRMAMGAEDLPNLAAARPALLRTVLSIEGLAAWWQWRLQQLAPLWSSARMGTNAASGASPQPRWKFSTSGVNFMITALQYPDRQAGLLWLGDASNRRTAGNNEAYLIRAFESDLCAEYGAADQDEPGPPVIRSDVMTPINGIAHIDLLGGTSWCSAPAQDDASRARIVFGARSSMLATLGADTATSVNVRRSREGFTTDGRDIRGVERWWWFLPAHDARTGATTLGVALVTVRTGPMANPNAPSTGSAVPQYLELVAESK